MLQVRPCSGAVCKTVTFYARDMRKPRFDPDVTHCGIRPYWGQGGRLRRRHAFGGPPGARGANIAYTQIKTARLTLARCPRDSYGAWHHMVRGRAARLSGPLRLFSLYAGWREPNSRDKPCPGRLW